MPKASTAEKHVDRRNRHQLGICETRYIQLKLVPLFIVESDCSVHFAKQVL